MIRKQLGSIFDLVDDVSAEIAGAPRRAMMMFIGVALSTGSLIAAFGVSVTAKNQISEDIAAASLDELTVSVASGLSDSDRSQSFFPDNVEERALSIDLVQAAGLSLDLKEAGGGDVSRRNEGDPANVRTLAVTRGYTEAVECALSGASSALLTSSEPIAYLGSRAADSLDIPQVGDTTGFNIWIDGSEFQIAGYISGDSSFESTVFIPYSFGVGEAGTDSGATLSVRTDIGGGPSVVSTIRQAIRPDRPSLLATSPVVSFDSLSTGVSAQISRLVAWVGALLLAVAALMISNAMIGAVVARTPEIGLRRALGASRSAITRLFLAEGALAGLLGGLGGGAIAMCAIVLTAFYNTWSVDMEIWWFFIGPGLGVLVGTLASLQPALRASRISPALAVRHD